MSMKIDKELKKIVQKRLGRYVRNELFAQATEIAEDILLSWAEEGRKVSDRQILLVYVLATKMAILKIEYIGEEIS